MQKKKLLPVKPNILCKLAVGVTQARVGQKRVGHSVSTADVLKFNLDHALARDAIHANWDYEKMRAILNTKGIENCVLKTKAFSREEYLLNPNSGASILEEDEISFKNQNFLNQKKYDIVLIVTDGLSSYAIEKHFIPFLDSFYSKLKKKSFNLAPLILAPYGRVALSDIIGESINARISIIAVGERPGLSAADSMGIYLTYQPKVGRQNSDRNCISNIRPPFGLNYAEAAQQLLNLIEQSMKFGFSGAMLKMD